MFNYKVMSEEEAMQERFSLIPDGEYDAEIIKSEDKISKSSGNQMIELTLNVYQDNGSKKEVKDFLLFTPSMMWKTRHCADSSNTLDNYNNMTFCSDVLKGKSVRVIVGSQEGSMIPSDKLNGKLAGSRYPSKNVIKDYVKKQNGVTSTVKKDDDFFNDDLPF